MHSWTARCWEKRRYSFLSRCTDCTAFRWLIFDNAIARIAVMEAKRKVYLNSAHRASNERRKKKNNWDLRERKLSKVCVALYGCRCRAECIMRGNDVCGGYADVVCVIYLYIHEKYQQRGAHIYIAEHIHSAWRRPPRNATYIFDSFQSERFYLICLRDSRRGITNALMPSYTQRRGATTTARTCLIDAQGAHPLVFGPL